MVAFRTIPSSDVAWISMILRENGVAFIARQRESLLPMNEAARALSIF